MTRTENGAMSSVWEDLIDLDIGGICACGNKRRVILGQHLTESEDGPHSDYFSAPC